MKKIILTGGGTAGHVTPNIALLPSLRELGFDIRYIGTYNGMEKGLIEAQDIPYSGISSGKLRRYFDLKNFTDPFRVLKGYFEANRILKSYKPDIVFSKGGFVSVPVVAAAHRLHIPVVVHESDITPGLANKLCFPYAAKICCNFPETLNFLPKEKSVLTGSPIRAELLSGSRDNGLLLTGFSGSKPVLLIIGGSLGSVKINNAIRSCLSEILSTFDIIHICGKGNLDDALTSTTGYKQYEYVSLELKDLFALSDIVISRAGANTICELLALKKPNILIPLSSAASRGDQVLNASSYKKQGFSYVLTEEELTDNSLIAAIHETYKNRDSYINAMSKSTTSNGVASVISVIKSICF